MIRLVILTPLWVVGFWEATMVMNEFGETGEGHGVDVLDVVVEGHSHACRGRRL